MLRNGAARKSDDQKRERGSRLTNEQLNSYLTAHAVRISPADREQMERSRHKRYTRLLLGIMAIPFFCFAMIASLAAGLTGKRRSTWLWDRLGLPVAASDMPDERRDVQ